MMTFVYVIAGLVILVAGAEMLVKGASKLALSMGISPLTVGLTVVAYGTSAPELVVSTKAAFAGQADIALGNVVGSNVLNILFILGISALAAPLIVTQKLIRMDVPVMIGLSVLFWLMSLDGRIGRVDGGILIAGLVSYTVFALAQNRKESPAIQEEYEKGIGAAGQASEKKPNRILLDLGLIAVGLAGLVFGADLFLKGAVTIARNLGVSELIIGLTLVAAGTSLPEAATSLIATLRGERDIAIGNVVGSNIYNILAILGITAFIPQGGLKVAHSMMTFDIPFMAAVAFACLPIFFSGYRISRWEGLLFLAYYFFYTVYLYLRSVQHDALPFFSAVFFLFVIPLTVITLAVVFVQDFKNKRKQAPPAES